MRKLIANRETDPDFKYGHNILAQAPAPLQY